MTLPVATRLRNLVAANWSADGVRLDVADAQAVLALLDAAKSWRDATKATQGLAALDQMNAAIDALETTS